MHQLQDDIRVVRSVAARLVGHGDADDIVQETFLRALHTAPSDRDAPLRPWLVTVARHVAIDWLRRRARWDQVELTDADGASAPAPVSAEPVPLATVLGALGSLTRSEVVALLLRDALDLSPEEAAVAMGSSPGSVRVLHHRARHKAAVSAPQPDSVAALEHFITWLMARELAGEAASTTSNPLAQGGVLVAIGQLLDGMVAATIGLGQLEGQARLLRGTSRRLVAPAEALIDLDRAVQLGANRSLARARAADLLLWLGRVPEAAAAAAEVLDRGDEPALGPRMHAILSRACLMAADDEGSRRHVAAAQAGGPTVEAANAVGVQLLLQGRYDQARVELLAALALCRQRGGHQEVAILNNVGVACMDDRRLDEAAHWLQECAALARARGDRGRESTALGNLAVVARHQGRLDEAETGFGRARALAQANERPAFAELWRMNRAIIDILRGRLEPAIDELTQTVAVFHELDDASDALTARLWLVVAETLRGRHGPEALRDFAPQAERAGKPTLATAARLLDRLHHLSTRQGRNDARAAAAQATGDGAIHTAGQLLRIQADRAERAG